MNVAMPQRNDCIIISGSICTFSKKAFQTVLELLTFFCLQNLFLHLCSEEFKLYLDCFCCILLGTEESLKQLLCLSHRFAPDIYFSVLNLTPQRSLMSIQPSSDSSKRCTMPAARFKRCCNKTGLSEEKALRASTCVSTCVSPLLLCRAEAAPFTR